MQKMPLWINGDFEYQKSNRKKMIRKKAQKKYRKNHPEKVKKWNLKYRNKQRVASKTSV